MTDTPCPGQNGGVVKGADTYDWDTTFATTFLYANKAIMENWANLPDAVKNIKESATSPVEYSLDGTFDAWQLTVGGDGKNIRMTCPLSGTYEFGTESFKLSSDPTKPTGVIIEVGMEWVPDPGQFAFTISDNAKVTTIKGDLDRSTIDSDLAAEFTSHGRTLTDAAQVVVQKAGFEWLIQDGKDTNYYIFYSSDKDGNTFLTVYAFEKAWINNLKVLAREISDTEPAVSIITITNNPTQGGLPGAGLESLLSEWFNANIGAFNQVFSILDLSVALDQSEKYAWIKPTATSYAVTDQGDLQSSVFGVLTMTGGNTPGDNHQVSIDAIPDGSQAAFLISNTQFMQNMMLPGARAIFNNAPASSFEIMPKSDGLTVQNTDQLVWGKFMMDNKKEGSVPNGDYAPQLDDGTIPSGLADDLANSLGIYVSGCSVDVTTKGSQWLLCSGKTEYILNLDGDDIDVYAATTVYIDKGAFKMTMFPSFLQVEFINLNYSYSADFDVHVNYTEQLTLGLKPPDCKVFWYTQVLRNMTVNVTKTKAAITREIVEGAITAALALVAVAGPILEGLADGAEITGLSEDEGSALIDEEAFAEAEADNPEAAEQNEEDAGNNAAAQSEGRLTRIKNAFNTPKWKVMGALAGLSGAIAGLDTSISAIIEAAVKNEWEHVPAFDEFANVAIAPYTFPGISGYTLRQARIAQSLQMGLLVAETDGTTTQ